MIYDEILSRFKVKERHGNKSKVVCPSHPDREASLSITYDDKEGKTILYCHAGCETREILDRVGLKMSDLFDKELIKGQAPGKGSNIEAVYKYRDIDGNVLFEKVRFRPKKFTQRRNAKGAVIWGLDAGHYYETYPGSNAYSSKKRDGAREIDVDGVEPVIYNLPEVINSIKNGETVYIVEGEKDADNLMKIGFTATCNFDGASKSSQRPKWKKEYNDFFKGANVVLLPDNDDPGRAHMNNIAENLNGLAKSIKIINLPDLPNKGDVSDWLEAHTKEELLSLINSEKEWIGNLSENDLDTVPVEFNPKYVRENGKRVTILPIKENIISVLKHYDYEIKYDEILRKVFVYKGRDLLNELGDDTICDIKDMCTIHNLNIPPQQLRAQLYRIGVDNTVNPVKEYLLECRKKWDGVSRLKELYATLQCDEAGERFKEKYIRKMLVTGVNLILSEGIAKSEGVLTLSGAQGRGKTTWFKRLVPKRFIEDSKQLYFIEGIKLDLGKKDSKMEVTSGWMLELGEIASAFKKNEIDDLKNFITSPIDRFRVPYGVASKDYRRYTFFVATVNDEEFLNDDTGNRRWWVLKCEFIDYNHNIDVDAIWGEAVYLWETGKETNFFTLDEQEEMNEYNTRFETLDNTSLLIMSYFNFNNEIRYWMKASDVFEMLGRPNNFNTKKLGIALKKLRLDTKQGGGRAKYYAMPPPKEVGNFNPKNFDRANYLDVNEVDEVTNQKVSMF